MAHVRNLQDMHKQLRQLGARQVELAQDSLEGFEAAVVRGDVPSAREILKQARLQTGAYKELREQLRADGVMLAKYCVEVVNDHTIIFVLPQGCSRIGLLKEAQGVVRARDLRDLVYIGDLTKWEVDARFTSELQLSERICIDGRVRGGDTKQRPKHEAFVASKGFALPNVEDLAVAFALYWVATGGPLFGYSDDSHPSDRSTSDVRAAGWESLFFLGRNGLHVRNDQFSGWGGTGVSALVSREVARGF